ncbi:hypothetical protein [Polaromonas sp.]|uniref:hypothetical protein n=1 Tax=Polaromonas sp. TaxID=1869339 RepID=UPI002FC740D2
MSHLRHTILTVAFAAASTGSLAQTAGEHTQHHPNTAVVSQASTKQAAPPARPGSVDHMAAMDSQMKAMREMHEKMVNAKTPEERNALMAEHMKAMQEGMAMMNMMGGPGMSGMQGGKPMSGTMNERQQMMEKRMDMMQSMMQMMMDCLPAPATK